MDTNLSQTMAPIHNSRSGHAIGILQVLLRGSCMCPLSNEPASKAFVQSTPFKPSAIILRYFCITLFFNCFFPSISNFDTFSTPKHGLCFIEGHLRSTLGTNLRARQPPVIIQKFFQFLRTPSQFEETVQAAEFTISTQVCGHFVINLWKIMSCRMTIIFFLALKRQKC